jgi:hypothetical protein
VPPAPSIFADGGYPPRSAEVSYGANCPVGTAAHWDYFTYASTTPASSRIDVTAHFDNRPDGGAILPANVDVVSIGAGSSAPGTCSFFGESTPCYVDLARKLGTNLRELGQVTLDFRLTASGSTYPSLAWWELRYSCVPTAFVGTCQALGRTWTNGSVVFDGCSSCTCRDGTLSCTKNDCATCENGDAALCSAGEYCDQRISCGTSAPSQGHCLPKGTADCSSGGPTICGCDGTTYANECLATSAGVAVQYFGACGTAGCWDGEIVPGGAGQCICSGGKVGSSCLYSPGGG